MRLHCAIVLLGLFSPEAAATAATPFAIQVLDQATGRGVPLVELTTVNNIRFVTDSAGRVAVDEPSLTGRAVFFHISSHGYEYPQDRFGYRGKQLTVKPGGKAVLKLRRINVAERLYRVTGGGIYNDSYQLEEDLPISQPLLNAGVLGSDSVVNAVFDGRIYWFWGDTNFPGYPLGNFHVPGATSQLPGVGGVDPSLGVDLEYFTDEDGLAKETCRMPGEGPTWIDGLTVLRDDAGTERLFAHYVKVKPPLDVYAHGICEFDKEAAKFVRVRELDPDGSLHPTGHPVYTTDGGIDYVYFARPFPYTRVRASVDSFLDPAAYEAYTCLETTGDPDARKVIRSADGNVEWAWRPGGIPVNATVMGDLFEQGKLTSSEAAFSVFDKVTGKPVIAHSGSLYWNRYRGKWVMVFLESWGASLLGEIWFAEAEAPTGPWSQAVKIVTHDNYSFYNPKQHPMFDQDGGRLIYFEATYTHTFTDNPQQTPRYDYNQIMYRLDLSDPRLGLDPPD